jgi:O-antigen/teichoic acid export membrane protein
MNRLFFLKTSVGRFIRSALTLSSGLIFGQCLILLAMPILTKLYSPANFGQFAIYAAWLSNLLVFMTGRYELAIVLPKSEEKANHLIGLSLMINWVMGILLVIMIWFFCDSLAAMLNEHTMNRWFFLLPLVLMLTGASQTYMQWNNRHCLYKKNAIAPVLRAATMILAQISCGLIGIGGFGLLIGHLVGQVTLLIVYAWGHPIINFIKNINLKLIGSTAKEYAKFPMVTMPQAFIGGLQDSLCFTLVGIISDSWMVGLLSLMFRVIRMPATLIGTAIAQIAYREMSILYRKQGNLAFFYRRLGIVLFILLLLPTFILIFFGAQIFAWFFGDAWYVAGKLAAVFAPYMLFYFLVTALGMLPLVLGKQQVTFCFTVLGSIVYIGALILGWYLWRDMVQAFYLVSASQSLFFIVYLLWMYRMAKKAFVITY